MVTPRNISLSSIHAGINDRTVFDKTELESLAQSIKSHGLAQPILVNLFSPDPNCVFGGDRFGPLAQYTIVAGERRFRAVKLLGEETIPANILEVNEEEASALMLTENIARADLDPIDEANSYQSRIDKFGWSIEKCAKYAGTSTIKIQFRLKLLNLREDLQTLVRNKNLLIGYAQILADGNLDTNRQMLAVKNLRNNQKPTTGWFRNIVNQYREQQLQAQLFDADFFSVQQEINPIQNETKEPAHPLTTTPPVKGKNPIDVLNNQNKFWTLAAEQWHILGKPFKSQECRAAALAVAYAVNYFVR